MLSKKLGVMLVVVVIASALTGCGGKGGSSGGGSSAGGGPPAMTPFERPGLTDDQRTINALETVAETKNAKLLNILSIFLGLLNDDTDIQKKFALGATSTLFTEWANDPYPVRSGETRKTKVSNIRSLSIVKRFARTKTRQLTDTISFTDENGWYWTVSTSETQTGISTIFTGIKGNYIIVAQTKVSYNQYNSATSEEISLNAKIGTFGAKVVWSSVFKLTETGNGDILSGTLRITGSAFQGGRITYRTDQSGSFKADQLTMGGYEDLFAQDGYWVRITYSNWKFAMDPFHPLSGSISFVASDGVNGTIVLDQNGTWSGTVKNKHGIVVAKLTGQLREGQWMTDFIDPSIPDQTIYNDL